MVHPSHRSTASSRWHGAQHHWRRRTPEHRDRIPCAAAPRTRGQSAASMSTRAPSVRLPEGFLAGIQREATMGMTEPFLGTWSRAPRRRYEGESPSVYETEGLPWLPIVAPSVDCSTFAALQRAHHQLGRPTANLWPLGIRDAEGRPPDRAAVTGDVKRCLVRRAPLRKRSNDPSSRLFEGRSRVGPARAPNGRLPSAVAVAFSQQVRQSDLQRERSACSPPHDRLIQQRHHGYCSARLGRRRSPGS